MKPLERRIDIISLRNMIAWSIRVEAIQTLCIIILIFLFLYISYRDREVFQRMVKFEEGKITHEVEALRKERANFTITGQDVIKIKKEKHYINISVMLSDYLANTGVARKFSDIKRIVMAVEEVVPKWFPDKSFEPNTFYALAKIESNFKISAVGKKYGERGVFQIKDYKTALKKIGKPKANPFDPYINVEMACHVLKEKHEKHKKYKPSIIAYNGYKLGKDRKVKERYWIKFKVERNKIRRLMKRI